MELSFLKRLKAEPPRFYLKSSNTDTKPRPQQLFQQKSPNLQGGLTIFIPKENPTTKLSYNEVL
jgi:hypothetical protein